MRKKVLLVIIDALASQFVEPAVKSGRLPNFRQLADAGRWQRDCISIFPSITPAATCSLASGDFPAQHGIGGAYWYVPETGNVEYFGDDVWVVTNHGVSDYFRGFQWRLNYECFRSETIYEKVEAHGLESACLNYMWFKGHVEHKMEVPLPFSFLPGVPSSVKIYGPAYAALGDFVRSRLPGSKQRFSGSGGMFGRYGFQDKATGQFLLQLAEARAFPDFTLAYFPDNDFDSHEEGPERAVSTVERVDGVLGKLLESFGGAGGFLDEFAFVLTGDHSQSLLHQDGAAGINLDELLGDFSITPAGESWRGDDDLMICPNMRAAEIYLRPGAVEHRREICRTLLECPKIDQLIWRENTDRPERFIVLTADRGELRFRPAGGGSSSATDGRGNRWEWSGDLATLDAQPDEEGSVRYGDYPNALERVANCFTHTLDSLWVTARHGYEFALPRTAVHNRGSHGSLHRLDSTSPLLTAGLPAGVAPPDQPSITDVVPLCLAALGISDQTPEGDRPAAASSG